ncbi:MAG: SpoIID/LytB domain-containing protein [Bacteroidales bacterium]|nr:SpoIID/LytB domain-containing protein [Bacteroidales bacterium]
MPYLRISGIFLFSLLLTLLSSATDISIGLFYRYNIESMVFSMVEGEYLLSGDGNRIAVVRKGTMFHISCTDAGLVVHDTAHDYGTFNELEFKGISSNNIFQVKPVFPSLRPKESEGDLRLTMPQGRLRIVNTLNLEKYLPGTVESEGGANAHPEYYKAQAVIARTFALKNYHRHAHEGFNLCDDVHCQAYNGKSRFNKQIYKSTRLTEGEYLAGPDGKPVVTPYHASCGGITARASDVWNNDLPYLKPVKDPFCNHSAHLNWKKTISLAEWNAYLGKKGFIGNPAALYTVSDPGRRKHLDPETRKLTMTAIRNDFGLKSSWFYIKADAHEVSFYGHGYGHGLGLCQEGAMEMARMGYTYVDILMFYFSNLKLIKP